MSLQKAIGALSFVSSDDRDTWVRIGMAMKSEFGEDGFDAWDSWSQNAESYNQKSARDVWRSIKAAGKVGIGTLYHEAAASGWRDNGEHRGPLTTDELEAKRRAKAARDAAAAAEERRKEEGYRRAAANATAILLTCKPLSHNYLRSKGLPDAPGLTMPDGELFVPMRDLNTNQLVGAQVIRWLMDDRRWEKKMLPGMRAKGAVLRLGSNRSLETWLCEGYATGLSIEAALRRMHANASVLVCFSAGNLTHVAPMVKGRKFIFADHDKSGTGEAAAKATGLTYCMSPIVGEDANDLHVRAGLFAVCHMVTGLRATAERTGEPV